MTTISTTGYGDAVPRTDLGKTVAVGTMVAGILLLSIPVAVFSINLGAAWDEKNDIERKRVLKQFRYKNSSREDQSKLIKLLDKRLQTSSIRMHKLKREVDILYKEEYEIRQLFDLLIKKNDVEKSNFNLAEKDPSAMEMKGMPPKRITNENEEN